MNDTIRRSYELLAKVDELLASRPRFNPEEWNARRPDPTDRNAWKAWLAELPDTGPLPETDFERSQREWNEEELRKAKAREKEREERAQRARDAAVAAALPKAPARAGFAPVWAKPTTRIVYK